MMKQFERIQRHGIPLAALCLVTVLVYARTLGHEFLTNWDDQDYVINNPAVRGFSLPHLKAAFTTFYVGNYAPVQIVSYMLDYSFWGMKPAGYFLTNIVVHLLNGLLFYLLLVKITGRKGWAFPAAFIFLLHPVQVETAAWVSQRKNLLAMFFFLASFLLYLAAPGGRKGTLSYAGSVVAFLLALLAKPVAVILPPVLLLYDLCFGRRGGGRGWLIDKLPYVIAAAAMALVTLKSQGQEFHGGMRGGYYGGSGLATFFTMLPVLLRYVGMLVWPADLSAFYDPPIRTHFDGVVAVAVLALLLLLVGGFWLYRRKRELFFWGAFFFLGLVPVSQIVPLTTIMNDRYLYFPMLGAAPFAVGAAAAAVEVVRGRQRATVAALLCLLLVPLPFLSFERAGVWRDSLTLWSDAYRKAPQSETVCYTLGATYHSLGKRDEALTYYRRAMELGPPSRDVLHNISMLYMEMWDYSTAWSYVRQLVERYPGYPPGYVILGDYHLRTGDLRAAEAAYQSALALQPNAGGALHNLGTVYYRLDEAGLARDCYLKALAAGSDTAELRYYLATIAAREGNAAEALKHLEVALRNGYSNRYEIERGESWDALRGVPQFQRLVKGYLGR